MAVQGRQQHTASMATSLTAATLLWLLPITLAWLGLFRPAWQARRIALLFPVSFLALAAGLFFLRPAAAIGGGLVALALVFPVLLVRHRLLRWITAATFGLVLVVTAGFYLWGILYLAPRLRGWE